MRGTDESPPPTEHAEALARRPGSRRSSPMQLISGAEQPSAQAVIAILCLRGRSE